VTIILNVVVELSYEAPSSGVPVVLPVDVPTAANRFARFPNYVVPDVKGAKGRWRHTSSKARL